MTLVIDPKVALLKGVDPVQFCVFLSCSGELYLRLFFVFRCCIQTACLRTTECLLQSAMQDPRTQIHGRENECKWSPAGKDAW